MSFQVIHVGDSMAKRFKDGLVDMMTGRFANRKGNLRITDEGAFLEIVSPEGLLQQKPLSGMDSFLVFIPEP